MNSTSRIMIMAMSFLAFVNCSNLNEQLSTANEGKQLPVNVFSLLKEKSTLHSKGLDECFAHYNSALLENKPTNFSRKRTQEFCMNFVANEPIFSDCSETRSTLTESEILGDTIVCPLSANAEILLKEFMGELLSSPNADTIYSYIQKLMETDRFLALDKEEQPFLIFTMLIGVDSAQYWSNPANVKKWTQLKNMKPTYETRGTAGPSASYWMTSDQMNNPTFKKLLYADMRGCGWSLLSGISAYGWMVGGIAGSVDAALF